MHIFSNSEYFNRAGSLIHTDPAGERDIEPPAHSRIYSFPPDRTERARFRRYSRWAPPR
jgi:hypothetical protein